MFRRFGFHRISPRELLSPFLGKIVNVEGIITKCTFYLPLSSKSLSCSWETDVKPYAPKAETQRRLVRAA
jgi:DNA replicative helicase MCM subunit Mcm2 (Cdc46/Mcm family)